MVMHNYKKLIVWQKSLQLTKEVYVLTEQFPPEELYGLVSQMRRAAVSIPSNIAEGSLRGHKKEFNRFLQVAFGSGGELETQIEVAKLLPKTANLDYSAVESLLLEVMKILNKMIN